MSTRVVKPNLLLRESAALVDALARFGAEGSAVIEALDHSRLDEVRAHLDARERMREEIDSRMRQFGVRLREMERQEEVEAMEEARRAVAEQGERCAAVERELLARAHRMRDALAANVTHARPSRDGYGVEMGGGWVDRRA